ncbi:MAG: ROK family protein [Lachnospiraceae bacterium]|jgi:fructokinase|nr:ROK family protein [Lachnospiraceae bacterium]
MKLGALEAGGTKMICATATEDGKILERFTVPTDTPETTMPSVAGWFREQKIDALGIGCFGPLDLDRKSPRYGQITSSPKLDWRGFDIVGYFAKEVKTSRGNPLPIGFDTDVNCACLGEATWGSTTNVNSSIYITVGTGIGVGIISEGRLHHGMLHPEAGHILIDQLSTDKFVGSCPYHRGERHCLEGLASGPAIEARWGKKAFQLGDRPEVWELEAHYLATAVVNYILVLSPSRIVIGGGVMNQKQLYPMIRERVLVLMNNYMPLPNLDRYIVPPDLDGDQGVMGGVKLALMECGR